MSSSRLATLLAAAAIAAGLAASPSHAQSQPDAARMAAARELVEASGGASMGQRVIDQMLDTMVRTMRQQNPSAAGSFEQVMRQVLSPDSPKVKAYFDDVVDIMTRFYAEKFSVEELRQVTEFQRSPVGQKFQTVLPEAMGRMGPAMMKFQASIMPDIREAIREVIEKGGGP